MKAFEGSSTCHVMGYYSYIRIQIYKLRIKGFIFDSENKSDFWIYQCIRIIKWSERYPFGLYNETFMWFPYTVPGGLSVSTSIIRVSFSASLNLLLICSIWQLIKLVDALASHIQMYWLETSDDSFKLSPKVSAFHVNANFDPDLINSGAMCQLENSKPKFCFLWLASLPTIKESWMGFFSTSWRRRCCCC